MSDYIRQFGHRIAPIIYVMQYIIFDLEATCWQTDVPREETEIIEIGSVRLEGSLIVRDDFGTFIRPVVHPELSSFCKQLTSITQEHVDSAPVFAEAIENFVAWIGPEPTLLCSWGEYDRNQLKREFKREKMPHPEALASMST